MTPKEIALTAVRALDGKKGGEIAAIHGGSGRGHERFHLGVDLPGAAFPAGRFRQPRRMFAREAVPPRPLQFPPPQLEEMGTVVDPGQGVDGRESVQCGLGICPFKGNGCQPAGGFNGLLVEI